MPAHIPALRRVSASAACLALLTPAALLGVGVGSAGAKTKHYPSAVRKAFLGSCVPAAEKSAKITKKQATQYCTGTLNCIERHMTIKQFEKNPASKTVTACEKVGAKKVTK